ncbi:MAG: preprotein translocase subunit YajC [Alphaproteobacteria bacterium]|nr:preprotein translocase subunit YajC [Alphaproteobacteria bacterium]
MITPAFANTSAQSPSLMMQFLPLIIIFAIFYFLLIRPQQKRAKEHREKIESINVGDMVITSGGIKGKVKRVEDTDIDVEIASQVDVKIIKSTIIDVMKK